LSITIPQAIEFPLGVNPQVLEAQEQINEFNQLVPFSIALSFLGFSQVDSIRRHRYNSVLA